MLTPETMQFLDGLWKAIVAVAGAIVAGFTALKGWGEIVKLRDSFRQKREDDAVSVLKQNVEDLKAGREADAADRKALREELRLANERIDAQGRAINKYQLDLQRVENEKADEKERGDRQQKEITALNAKAETLTSDLLKAQNGLIDVQKTTISNQQTIIQLQQQHQSDAEKIQELIGKLQKAETANADLLEKLTLAQNENRDLLIEKGKDRQRISDLESEVSKLQGTVTALQTTVNHTDANATPMPDSEGKAA